MKLRSHDDVKLTVSADSLLLLPSFFAATMFVAGWVALVALSDQLRNGKIGITDAPVALSAGAILISLYLVFGILRRTLSPPRWQFDRALNTVSIWGELDPSTVEKFPLAEIDAVRVASGAEALQVQVATLRRHRQQRGKKPGIMLRTLEKIERMQKESDQQQDTRRAAGVVFGNAAKFSNGDSITAEMSYLCLRLKNGQCFLLCDQSRPRRETLEAQAQQVNRFINQ